MIQTTMFPQIIPIKVQRKSSWPSGGRSSSNTRCKGLQKSWNSYKSYLKNSRRMKHVQCGSSLVDKCFFDMSVIVFPLSSMTLWLSVFPFINIELGLYAIVVSTILYSILFVALLYCGVCKSSVWSNRLHNTNRILLEINFYEQLRRQLFYAEFDWKFNLNCKTVKLFTFYLIFSLFKIGVTSLNHNHRLPTNHVHPIQDFQPDLS